MICQDDISIFLGDLIATEVLYEFRKMTAKGKPATRSNGVNEWTVLASVVAVINGKTLSETPEIRVLTLATGVKSLPVEFIDRNSAKGRLVHDSHAEILALRMFNYYLINEILRLEGKHPKMPLNNIKHESILMKQQREPGFMYKIKDDVELALYISELPCGDASLKVSLADDNGNDVEAWQTPVKRLKTGKDNNGIIRGRNHYSEEGLVRTKPGRPDSPVSLSKSCSDKLTLKQYIGILNCVTSLLISPKNSFLRWLVIPKPRLQPSNCEDIIRCFKTRLQTDPNLQSDGGAYLLRHYEILPTEKKFEYSKHDADQVPSMNAIVYLADYQKFPNTNMIKGGKNPIVVHEVINSGVKLGCKSKKEKNCISSASSSVISRRKLTELAIPIIPNVLEKLDYAFIKQSNKEREAAKTLCQNQLGGWVKNTTDNFPSEIKKLIDYF